RELSKACRRRRRRVPGSADNRRAPRALARPARAASPPRTRRRGYASALRRDRLRWARLAQVRAERTFDRHRVLRSQLPEQRVLGLLPLLGLPVALDE